MTETYDEWQKPPTDMNGKSLRRNIDLIAA